MNMTEKEQESTGVPDETTGDRVLHLLDQAIRAHCQLHNELSTIRTNSSLKWALRHREILEEIIRHETFYRQIYGMDEREIETVTES